MQALICPATARPMEPGFTETLQVLARRRAVFYVKHYERTGFVIPANSAPVYTAWSDDILARSRVDVSIVAHVATALKREVLGSGDLMLDAPPVPLCYPARLGAAREATLWAYRNAAGTVWVRL